MRKKRKTESIGDCLPELLKAVESSYRDDGHRIWEIWDRAVGPELARRVHPTKFRNGKLTVAVEGASWLQQIVFIAPKLIEAVNASLGKPLVQSLKGVAAEVQPETQPVVEEKFLRDTPLTEDEVAEIELELSSMKDGPIKDAARNARIASMLRIKQPADG